MKIGRVHGSCRQQVSGKPRDSRRTLRIRRSRNGAEYIAGDLTIVAEKGGGC